MNWDSEIDLVAGPRPLVRQGRRAGNREIQSPRESEDAPPVVRGGWNEEGKKSAKYSSSANLIENDQAKETEDAEDDIPVIPDIDEIQDDSVLQEIRPAKPQVSSNIYKELETELSNVASVLQKQDSKTNEVEAQLADLFQEIMGPFKNFNIDDNEEWTMDYLFQKRIKAADSEM